MSISLTARHLTLNGWQLLINKPRLPLPIETPQCDPQRLMLLSEMAAIRIWSNARVKKVAKVLAKATVLSRVAQPTAMLTWKEEDCTGTVNSSFMICFQEIICATSYCKTLARSSWCWLKSLLLIVGLFRKDRRPLAPPVSIFQHPFYSLPHLLAIIVDPYWQLLLFICSKQPYTRVLRLIHPPFLFLD